MSLVSPAGQAMQKPSMMMDTPFASLASGMNKEAQ